MLKYFIALLLFLLFASKVHVFYLEKYVADLNENIKRTSDEVHVLEIEWSYINNNKLRELVNELLPGWGVTEIQQTKTI
jgi:hypothetical protein